jgi:hypothetical protein
MGLKQLEWHEQKNNGWVARTVEPLSDGRSQPITRRYAHVNIVPLGLKRVKQVQDKVFVEFMSYSDNYAQSWHDSIDAGKLYVEAIFALDND